MPRYKNTTNNTLKFRANNSKGIKQVFEIKPGKEFESDREVTLAGLESVGKGKLNKKTKGDD